MSSVNNPYFWALLAMFGLIGGDVVVGTKVFDKSNLPGLLIVCTVTFGRMIMVLPFVDQPRLGLSDSSFVIGVSIIVVALLIWVQLFGIQPLTQPDKQEPLNTRGLYAIVRHPGYLGNILWGFGWALAFESIIGMALTPLWWLAFLLHTLIEEESLEREYGDAYVAYKQQVRSRIIPGLRF